MAGLSQRRRTVRAFARAASLLLVSLPLAAGPGLSPPARADDTPIWTDRPVHVDPTKQDYERLPARLPPPETHLDGLKVPPFIRVEDSALFHFDRTAWRISGVKPIAINKICVNAKGERWGCGRMAAILLGRLVRGQRLKCRPFDRTSQPVELDCEIRGRSIAAIILEKGFGRAAVPGLPLAAEGLAREAKAGIWGDPVCLNNPLKC